MPKAIAGVPLRIVSFSKKDEETSPQLEDFDKTLPPLPGSFLQFLGEGGEEKLKSFNFNKNGTIHEGSMTPRQTAQFILDLGTKELERDLRQKEHEQTLDPFQKQKKPNFRLNKRSWIGYGIIPFTSLFLCIVCYGLDVMSEDIVHKHYTITDLMWSIFNPDSTGSSDLVRAAITTMSLLFGILMSIIGIILQMAAEKITPHVTSLFFNDTSILSVVGFVIFSNICVVITLITIGSPDRYLPRSSVISACLFVISHMILLFPFMRYLFYFLEPDRVVANIMMGGLSAAANGINDHGRDLSKQQVKATISVEMLMDAASSALRRKDKSIAAEIVDALCSFTTHYGMYKSHMYHYWFRIPLWIRRNTDFLMLSDESISQMREKKTWMEWKVLRQYHVLFSESLNMMKEMCYHIAMNTRILGEAAAKRGDIHTVDLVLKFFNTFLRLSLGMKDVRTCYNVLFQYRRLGEKIVEIAVEQEHDRTIRENELEKRALRLAKYLRFYVFLSSQMVGLPFLVEVMSHDIRCLCEASFKFRSPIHDKLLQVFLTITVADAPNVAALQNAVRNAQFMLATYYLVHGSEELAKAVHDEFPDEPYIELWKTAENLNNVKERQLWEVSERGENFKWMPDEQKAKIPQFLSMFKNWNPDMPIPFSDEKQLKSFLRRQDIENFT